MKIAIDIDAVLRDAMTKIDHQLGKDFPEKQTVLRAYKNDWNCITRAFNDNDQELIDWMYHLRAFHIFGQAPKVYPKVMEHLNALNSWAKRNDIEIWLWSHQIEKSIPATLFWLAKNGCEIENYKFYTTSEDKMEDAYVYDIIVDDHPKILEVASEIPEIITIAVPYNHNIDIIRKKNNIHLLQYPIIDEDRYKVPLQLEDVPYTFEENLIREGLLGIIDIIKRIHKGELNEE
ncbi:MAG: hypothetical protein ACFFG0_18930 [Candidatus Thorarchaeota archaeon]